MKKVLSLIAIIALTSTLSASAAETAVGSFFDKVNKKEQEELLLMIMINLII